MDLNATSDQQLLYFIIFSALLGLFFGLTFIISLILFVRKKRKQLRELDGKPSASPANSGTGGSPETMSLLKSTAKKSEVTPAPPPPPAPPAELELLSLWYDPLSRKIVVKIDGQRFEHISQVKDRAIGQRILEAAAALLHFTGGIIATATGTKSVPAPEVKLTIPANAAPPAPADEATRHFSTQKETQTIRESSPPTEAVKESKATSWGARKKEAATEEKPAASPAFSLADEIDSLIQNRLKLAQNPTAVKITSGADGMIVIRVENKQYSSIDEVEDPAVKAIIKEAVREWEKH